MGNVASQSRWVISSTTQGNKRLKRVESSKVSSDASREGVTAQGEDQIIGTIFKPGAITISFTVFEEEGTPEVDWRSLFASGEYFTLTREIVRGKRYQYVNVQVSKAPDPDGDNAGKHMFTVECISSKEKPL
jgi:hypothetical protein